MNVAVQTTMPAAATSVRLPCWGSRYARAWPEHAIGETADYLAPVDLFTLAFPSDVHLAAYACPEMPRRLNVQAPARLETPPAMVAALLDVDAPEHAATPAWRADLRERAAKLPGEAFGYWTRGGARLVYLLTHPFAIVDAGAASAWSRFYTRTLLEIACLTGIVADPKCRDWTHLFRAPHATRDGVLEAHGWVCGAPHAIGALPDLDVDPADVLALGATLAARSEPWRQALVHVLPPKPTSTVQGPSVVRGNGSKALAYVERKVRGAGKGARNGTLYASARWLGELADAGEVARHEAEQVLVRVGLEIGLGAAEVRRTVASAMRTK